MVQSLAKEKFLDTSDIWVGEGTIKKLTERFKDRRHWGSDDFLVQKGAQ